MALHAFYFSSLYTGLLLGVCAAVLYLLANLNALPGAYWGDLALRVAFLFLVGLSAGLLALELKRSYHRLQEYAAKIEEANQALESRLGQITALYEASKALNTMLRLDQILSMIVDITSEMLQSPVVYILLWDEGEQKLTFHTWKGLPDDLVRHVSLEAGVCHDPHKKTHEVQLRWGKEETCVECHTGELEAGKKWTPGKEVHHPQKEFWLGVGGLEVPDMPAKKVITCADCHMTNGNHFFKVGTPELTLKVKGQDTVFNSCSSCHARMTKEEVEAVQKPIEARITALKADLAAAKKKLDAMTGDTTFLKNLYNVAYTNVSYVEADASKGIHNPAYARALLDVAEAKVKDLKWRLP